MCIFEKLCNFCTNIPLYRKGRAVSISTKAIFGKEQEVKELLEASPVSKTVNISLHRTEQSGPQTPVKEIGANEQWIL